ncbi:TPA: hypothetical protein J1300_004083 [Escherichia coli]|nr:hypothetical protein [Escherichia coli]HBA9158314.1 hypothetical protein [Escherichia coli]
MSQKYLIRITELERLLSEQAEALCQKELQLSLVEETEPFLCLPSTDPPEEQK